VFVGAGAEALDRGDDHARIEFLDTLPAEAHPVERAGREILDQHIALPDQRFQHFLAGRPLGVERHRALVMVEHGEIEAVHARDVAQLATCRIALAGALDLDDIRPEPGQQLGTGGSGLDMGEIENANAFQRLAHTSFLRRFHLVIRILRSAIAACKRYPRGIRLIESS